MIGLAIMLSAAALVGACLGSFVAAASLRWIAGRPFIAGRSACDGCGRSLGYAKTVPLVSFFARRGVADCCGGAIDPLHPIAEFSGALIAMLCLLIFGWSFEAALLGAWGLTLLGLALIDHRTYRLPDPMVIALALASAGLALLTQGAIHLLSGCLWAAGTYLVLEGLRRAFATLRGRQGLGAGDVKLFAALAIWFGPLVAMEVALAAALGLVQLMLVRPQDGRIAFGPAAGIAAVGIAVVMVRGAPWL